MNSRERTKAELLNDLRHSKTEINRLKKAEDNYKKIAEALNQERELYADLTNAVPAGIYRLRVFHDVSLVKDNWSNSNNAPYILEFANDRFFEILNLDRLSFEKNHAIINDLIFEADRAEFARMNVEANLNVTPFVWEGRFMIKSNTIWILFKSIPRVLENGDIIWTGTVNNISEQKNAELKIALKNKELQTLNADKDRFISILSHDLRSPFTNLLGLSEMLNDNMQDFQRDECKKIAEELNNTAQSTFNLLEELLMWARTQQGKIPFNPQILSFKDICKNVVDVLKPNANAKDIALNNFASPDLTVFADSDMLKTILRNLVSNAIKFTNSGGKININAVKNSENVTISVSDNGIGISSDDVAKLFNISEVHSTKGTAGEPGTGLGFLLCKEFIEKHGGKIWVESEVQKGSVFKFTIPVFNEKPI